MSEKRFNLGRVLDDKEKLHDKFYLDEDELKTHMAVLGRTGSGKSRFLNQFVREHIDQKLGIAVIDPGDLCHDVMAYQAKRILETNDKRVLKKIHYLRASPGQVFGIDPFRFHLAKPVHPELVEAFRRTWVHCKVQSISEIFQAKITGSSDFEGQPRRQRITTDALYGVATEVEGKRLALGDAEILIDITHEKHNDVFAKLARKLPQSVVGDINVLLGFKRLEEVRRETESTINGFRSLLGPIMKAIFSRTEGPVIDFVQIIQKGHCLLLPVQEDPFFSHDQKITLSAVMLHELLSTLIMTPREMRRPFTIVIEEVGELLAVCGEWLTRSLGMLRKHGGRLVISGQDLSTFRHDDIDLGPKLLSQCGKVVCFNQKWPEDTEVLSRVLFSGNLEFNPLVQEVERHGGYEWYGVEETGCSRSNTFGLGQGESEQDGITASQQTSRQESETKNKSKTLSSNTGTGHVETQGNTFSHSDGSSSSPILVDGQQKMPSFLGSSEQNGTSSHASQANSSTKSNGEAETEGEASMRGKSTGNGFGQSKMFGTTNNQTLGFGITETKSNKLVPLAKIVREKQKTGQLETSINDQLEKFRQMLACLKQRHAFVWRDWLAKAVEIEALEVKDPFVSAEAQVKAVNWMERELFALHPYFFTPTFDDDPGRFDPFLGGQEEADEPTVVQEQERDEKENPMD